jgi:NIPSNAP
VDRRNFLSASLAASALSLAGADDAIAQAASTSASSTAASSAPEYYDLRRYQLASGPGVKLTDNYFSNAFIPALNRLGIGPIGAFSVYFGPETPAYYLLMPSSKLETLVTADLQVAKDEEFMKAAAPFWDAPAGSPPYIRIESSLLRAFPGYPRVTPPASAATKGKRIYQLRQYQSPTNMDHVSKVEMFHHGEFDIFAKAGATGVFYADTLIGPRLPNLTYMLSFPDMTSLEIGWEKFLADPDWKKLSADPRFKLDPPTVSNVTSLVLRPLPYSQV